MHASERDKERLHHPQMQLEHDFAEILRYSISLKWGYGSS